MRSIPLRPAAAASRAAANPTAASPADSGTDPLDAALRAGRAAFARGDTVAAVAAFTRAADIARDEGRPASVAEALLRRGEAYQTDGRWDDAAGDFDAALRQATTARNALLIAAAAGSLGGVMLLRRRTAIAEPLLRRAEATARQAGDPGIMAAVANDLGNLLAVTNRETDARREYDQAIRLADSAGNRLLAATAAINAARLALAMDPSGAQAARLIDTMLTDIAALPPSMPLGLDLAAAAMVGAEHDAPPPAALRPALQRAIAALTRCATALDSAFLRSLSDGAKGRLEERLGQPQAAYRLTDAARAEAIRAVAPGLQFRWDWQQARIERRMGRDDAALSSYRRAVAGLEAVRQDIPVAYVDGHSSFRETFGPLYTQEADLLLRRAAQAPGADAAQPYLREARVTVERLRASELNAYFSDRCVTEFQARQRSAETISADTAVLYPVILPDRLEMLVSIGTEMRRYAVPIGEQALHAEMIAFRRLLERRSTYQFLEPARRLHDLMIPPLLAMLDGRGIRNLVLVPGGSLRQVPFGTLYDGRHFLAERFAMAIVPGLELTDPRPLPMAHPRMLLAAITVPREGFVALPGARAEAEGIAALNPRTTRLINGAFTSQAFADALRGSDYRIVHIASHGEFGDDPSRTFVLAYNEKLTMDRLGDAILPAQFRHQAVELLTLSACRTAVGDERAQLGLAGLAIKAGARSALATDWYVNDQAASAFVLGFYRALFAHPADGKAAALKAIQARFLADPILNHPAYWAAFQLVGNWL